MRPRRDTRHSSAPQATTLSIPAPSVTCRATPIFTLKASDVGGVRVPRTMMPPLDALPCPLFRTTTVVTWSRASSGSQRSPIPSPSRSCWAEFAIAGQLSSASQMPSPSESPPPPIVHVPAWQVSGAEHTWLDPLAHGVPSGAGLVEHSPVKWSQVGFTWHWAASQTTGFVPTQVPAWQESAWVQASPSVQAEPSGLFGVVQAPVPGLHVP